MAHSAARAAVAAAGLGGLCWCAVIQPAVPQSSDAATSRQQPVPAAPAGPQHARQRRRQAAKQDKAAKKIAREAGRKRNLLVRGDPRERMRQAAQEHEQGASVGCDTVAVVAGAGSSAAATTARQRRDGRVVSLREQTPLLREFSLALLPPPSPSFSPGIDSNGSAMHNITSLDLSHNELAAIDGLEALKSLTSLDVSRNWLRALPKGLTQLPELATLSASRNFLRPNAQEFLLLLPSLTALRDLDLSFNKKCGHESLADLLREQLPRVNVKVTITVLRDGSSPEGAFVGNAACDRDATLLRSQLEPWGTLALRRRLEDCFGEPPAKEGAEPSRAEVMKRLLECYSAVGPRKLLRCNGTLVAPGLLAELRTELELWVSKEGTKERLHMNQQERPSIRAQSYMILRAPSEFGEKLRSSKANHKAHVAKLKYEQNMRLWELAAAAIKSIDPEFAKVFTALAVTQNFQGSPHIDKTNIGPFYGLAIGDHIDGTGGVRVEVDAMTVCEVNTKDRLGKIDGRMPHWVAPYDDDKERFSLIYYQTEGEITPTTTAVFAPYID